MKYAVVIEGSDQGLAGCIPGSPGRRSQRTAEAEALENIADAIRGYLDVAMELTLSKGAKQVLVEI